MPYTIFEGRNSVLPVSHPKDKYLDIYNSVRYLAGVDDYATSLDGQGFNKFDAQFGQSLANRPWEAWTNKQIVAAYNMIRRYKKQLAVQGFMVDLMPEPSLDALEVTAKEYKTHNPTVKHIDMEEGLITVQFQGLSKNDFFTIKDAVAAIPGRVFVGERKLWTIPISQSTASMVADLAIRFDFTAPDHVQNKILELSQVGTKMVEASKKTESDLNVIGLGGTLRPFQKAAVEFGLMANRILLGDDMGLGKTIEALAILQARQAFPALVVCPKTLKINWQREAEKWLPGRKIMRMNGGIDAQTLYKEAPDIFIVHYEALVRKDNAEELARCPWEAVIFDEAHRLKNEKAQRSQAAYRIAYSLTEGDNTDYRYVDEARAIPNRMLLTGTPVLNRPIELLNLLKILGRVKDVAPKGSTWFKNRYCGGWDGHGYNGSSHLDELHDLLRATCMIRRVKSEVLTELPELQRIIIPVDITNRKEYDKATEDILTWVAKETERKLRADEKFLAEIKHLTLEQQQEEIINRGLDAADRAARAERLVAIGKLKQIAARGKRKAIEEWVEDFMDSDEKLVIYAFFIETQQDLIQTFEAKGFDIAKILGSENDDRIRSGNVDKFQNEPDCRLLIGSMKAGGEGVTLTAASNMAIVEFGWTPAEHDQAEARIHRMGQMASSASIWYFVATGTIDEWIAELLDEKRKVVNAVTDGRGIEEGESLLEGLWDKLTKEAQKKGYLNKKLE